MNNYIRVGVPATLFALSGMLVGCNHRTKIEDNLKKESIHRESVEKVLAKRGISNEEFTKQRLALGIDPSVSDYQALLKIDSAIAAPVYQKYGVKQPATNATQEVKILASIKLSHAQHEKN